MCIHVVHVSWNEAKHLILKLGSHLTKSRRTCSYSHRLFFSFIFFSHFGTTPQLFEITYFISIVHLQASLRPLEPFQWRSNFKQYTYSRQHILFECLWWISEEYACYATKLNEIDFKGWEAKRLTRLKIHHVGVKVTNYLVPWREKVWQPPVR